MVFNTSSLLSKWGFDDGDMLDEFCEQHYYEAFDKSLQFDHELLCAVVKKHVIPKLDQKVEVITLRTIHNPIRVASVDGENVNVYEDGDIKLTPSTIEVTDEQLHECAKKLL